MENEEIQEVEEQEADEVQPEEDSPEEVEATVPTAEDEEEEVDEPAHEPKMVPVDALQDERRKRQELEQKLDQIQQGVDSLKGEKPPKDIYEAFDKDSEGVTRDLNQEINRLVTEGAYENANQIERLKDLKDELRRREFNNLKTQLSTQTTAQETRAKIAAQIPDLNSKIADLERFAVEELGYSPEELFERCHVSKGESAVREVTRINKLYDRFHAKPQKKAVKQKATQVEDSGKGVQKTGPNLQQLLEKAQQTGDWEEYFDAKGLL